MYVSHHLATGIICGAICPDPLIGVSVSFLSHLIGDMLAEASPKTKEDRSAFWTLEAIFWIILFAIIYFSYPNWWYYLLCGLSANGMDVIDKTIGNNKIFHYSWQAKIKLTMEQTIFHNLAIVVLVWLLGTSI